MSGWPDECQARERAWSLCSGAVGWAWLAIVGEFPMPREAQDFFELAADERVSEM